MACVAALERVLRTDLGAVLSSVVLVVARLRHHGNLICCEARPVVFDGDLASRTVEIHGDVTVGNVRGSFVAVVDELAKKLLEVHVLDDRANEPDDWADVHRWPVIPKLLVDLHICMGFGLHWRWGIGLAICCSGQPRHLRDTRDIRGSLWGPMAAPRRTSPHPPLQSLSS